MTETTSASETRRRRPRFQRADTPQAVQITGRDVEIIRQVARHRFLRSTHIFQLIGGSPQKISERLGPLYHAGFLDRPRSQLEYHVRGGGSAPLVYALGNRGAQLLRIQDGLEDADVDWARKNHKTGREFILHTLAIADLRVALTLACRERKGFALLEPDQLLAAAPEETQRARSPWSWRVRVQHHGSIQEIGLLPDYVFALILPDGRRRPFLVEIDRGTMPVARTTLDQSSMLRKFLAYEGGRKQAVHTSRFGWKNFRVLVSSASAERLDTMPAVITRAPELKSSPLFLFAEHRAVSAANILDLAWRDASDKIHSLV
jgi:hypothetical protein